MIVAPLIVCAVLALPPMSQDTGLTSTDAQLRIVDAVLTAVDGYQTIRMQHRGCDETNPILGRHPSDATSIAYFAGAGIVLWTVVPRLPKPWMRRAALVAWGAVQGFSVAHNAVVMNFRF